MTPLDIPVPPQLELVVGYGGDARLVSICWTCCGDTVVYDDGRSSGTGHGWGYLGFARHPTVAPLLRDLDLGSSEQDGTQRLLLDRQERRAFAADAAEARAVVRGQWPAEPEAELTHEQWQQLVEQVRQTLLSRPMPTMAELMQQVQDRDRLVNEMVAWLDQQAARKDP